MTKYVAQLLVSVALIAMAPAAPAYSGELGPTRTTANFDAYYDGYYGPFYNGYWSRDGVFFYSTGPARPYVRDDGDHFRRAMTDGFVPVEGSGPQILASASARR